MARGRRVMLTMQQRMDFLKDLETSSVTNVAEKYKICLKTITRIKENIAEINNFANKGILEKHRKSLRTPTYEELEQRLFLWFTEMEAIGHAVSDVQLLEKAAELKEELRSCSNFKVSKEWLIKFKRRYHISLVHIDGEKASADQYGVNLFVSDFQKYIEKENINLENIYTMGETGLLWKALPMITLVCETGQCVSDYRLRKDRVMIGICANATGTHKTMPLVIHKFKKPRALKHCADQLPVIFKAQANAWMNQLLFIDWFENHFKKEVCKYQLENRLCGKVVLLVDNCTRYKFPSNYEYDDYFVVKYLPPNTTPLIQPMDQGVIGKLKRCFQLKLTQHLSASRCGIEEFYKMYTIKDCTNMISESWKDVTCNNIKNAWKDIIPNMERNEDEIGEGNITFEMQQAWARMSKQDITIKDIENYFTVCREEEQRLSGIFEDMNEDEDEDRDEDGDEDGDDEWSAEKGDEEWSTEEEDEEMTSEKGDEGRATEEGNKEYGLKLPREIREEFEDIFKCMEPCKKYIPHAIRYLLEGVKLTILGDTTSK